MEEVYGSFRDSSGSSVSLPEELTYSQRFFGSLTYDRKLSFPEEVGEYEVVDFLESIKKSKESL